MQLPDVNLDAISDPATREVIRQLLNIIEAQAVEIAALRAENQQLRDEVARLKGGSGKPNIKPSVQPPSTDHSSEAERHTRTPRDDYQPSNVVWAMVPPWDGPRKKLSKNAIRDLQVERALAAVDAYFAELALPA